jgi:3-hydroxyisobutyrate dehydrogenase-like beta-hydroxyacid dehydrogenase
MGLALGKILMGEGYRVVTTLEGRGPRTRQNCAEAGFEVLPNLQTVARVAHVVFSVVPPQAAQELAVCYCSNRTANDFSRIYVDLNSIAPELAVWMSKSLAAAGVEYVDGCVHGPASMLRERGKIYLSGPSAEIAAELLRPELDVKVLGREPGTASALKMLIAGLNKGVTALFLEMSLAARRAGLLDEVLASYQGTYPGIMDIVERTLPTYPRHATRRGYEMREVEKFLGSIGLQAHMTAGAQKVIAAMGELGLAEDFPDRLPGDWPTRNVVEELHRRQLLQTPREPNLNWNTPGDAQPLAAEGVAS